MLPSILDILSMEMLRNAAPEYHRPSIFEEDVKIGCFSFWLQRMAIAAKWELESQAVCYDMSPLLSEHM